MSSGSGLTDEKQQSVQVFIVFVEGVKSVFPEKADESLGLGFVSVDRLVCDRTGPLTVVGK